MVIRTWSPLVGQLLLERVALCGLDRLGKDSLLGCCLGRGLGRVETSCRVVSVGKVLGEAEEGSLCSLDGSWLR